MGDVRHPGAAREERKVVTVLFVDLVDFTSTAERLDPEDVRRLQVPYYSRVRAELERHGATVEKFIGDAVVGVFGAPLAHEDDGERAVRAAFAIGEAVARLSAEEELGLAIRIGITTGEALVDLDARPSHGEGFVAGDMVNVAARLQAAAPPGGILVSEATAEVTRNAVEYREADPLRVKGKERPLRVFRAVSLLPGDDLRGGRGSVPLVGRRAEVDTLLELVDAAQREGKPRVVVVSGPAGIGKTRLARELLHALRGSALWLQGRCLPYGEDVTFWALGEMVKAAARILDNDPAERAGEKLAATVARHLAGNEGEWVRSHLEPLAGLGEVRAPGPDSRSEAFAAWRRFFEAQATGPPCVLMLEDVHWADDGLLDFVEHLADWADGALVVVCTARPELDDRRAGWLEGRGNVARIVLAPLAAEESAQLLAALLEREASPELVAATGGIPLYAQEYAGMVAERGSLPFEELPPPPSLGALISARVDALPPSEKAALLAAAVVGRRFWRGAVDVVGRAVAGDALDELARRELVRREPQSLVDGEEQYVFAHALVCDVAYSMLPRSSRADMHRRAAAWLGTLAPDRSDDRAEMLAYHYERALEYARLSRTDTAPLRAAALLAFVDACDRSLALYGFAAAARYARLALDLTAPDDPFRPYLLARLAKARFWSDGADEDDFDEARTAAVAVGDLETAAELDTMLARLLLASGDLGRAVDAADRAVQLVEGRPASRAKATALAVRAGFAVFAGNTDDAAVLAGAALELAEETGLNDVRANALTSLGVARTLGGDRNGLADLGLAVAVAEEQRSPEVVRAFGNLGSTLVLFGDLRGAFEAYARGRQAAERFGDARGLSWFDGERLYQDYWEGRWDAALRDATTAVDAAGDYVATDARLVRTWIALARDELESADADSSVALAAAREGGEPVLLCAALTARAQTLLAGGDTAGAGELAGELADLCTAGAYPTFWLLDAAHLFRALGRKDVLPAADGEGWPWLTLAHAVLADEHLVAAEHAASFGTRPGEAYCRLHAGAALLGEGARDAAFRELDRAAAFFREVGAKRYLRETERLAPAQV